MKRGGGLRLCGSQEREPHGAGLFEDGVSGPFQGTRQDTLDYIKEFYWVKFPSASVLILCGASRKAGNIAAQPSADKDT